MTKIIVRRKAIELRKQGKSYGEILKEIKVSKSSLSLWLKDVPLTKEQINGIKDIRKKAIEKYRQTMQLKRQKRNAIYYKTQEQLFLPLTQKELLVAGLFLYWGEGNKANRHTISINNTDPSMIKFALYWITKGLTIPKEKVRVQIHLYQDMNVEEEINFWSKELKIHKSQFAKPYIKHSKRSDIDQKGFGHGTCGLVVHNTILKENALMAIKAISDHFNEKIINLI